MATNKRLIKSNDEGGAVGNSFQTVTYPGNNGANTLYTTNDGTAGGTGGFQPDMVWLKRRNDTANHRILDSVRGADIEIYPNLTNAEGDFTTLNWSFNSDGFSFNTNDPNYNSSTGTYVAWCWKAGGAAVANTDGSITSQVSANTEAGFSIVSYTGNTGTLGHGLGVIPKVIIQKKTNVAEDWYVYFPPGVIDGNYNYMVLNSTAAASTTGSTPPTTTTFNPVASSGNYIAYCFAEVPGFSKFGSYTGTGVAGNIQDCGFEPAFVMIKITNEADHWWIWDNKRNPSNPASETLLANLNIEEYTLIPSTNLNFLSNGFEAAGEQVNNLPGRTYVYMAFANQF